MRDNPGPPQGGTLNQGLPDPRWTTTDFPAPEQPPARLQLSLISDSQPKKRQKEQSHQQPPPATMPKAQPFCTKCPENANTYGLKQIGCDFSSCAGWSNKTSKLSCPRFMSASKGLAGLPAFSSHTTPQRCPSDPPRARPLLRHRVFLYFQSQEHRAALPFPFLKQGDWRSRKVL